MEFTIQEKLMHEFSVRLEQQCAKGREKYGTSLDDCPDDDYNWQDMMFEELLDFIQYQRKYIQMLEKRQRARRKKTGFWGIGK